MQPSACRRRLTMLQTAPSPKSSMRTASYSVIRHAGRGDTLWRERTRASASSQAASSAPRVVLQ